MKNYVEYEVEGEKSIIIEVEDNRQGFVPAARSGEVVEKAKQSFEKALDTIRPITDKLLVLLDQGANSPDEIGVEFGLKLGFQAGAVITSGSTEANFKISLKWKRKAELK